MKISLCTLTVACVTMLTLTLAAPRDRGTSNHGNQVSTSLLFQSERDQASHPKVNTAHVSTESGDSVKNSFFDFGSKELHKLKAAVLKKVDSVKSKLSHSISKATKSISLNLECDACRLGVGLIQSLVKQNYSKEDIVEKATEFCTRFRIESERVCKGICQEFAPEVIAVLEKLVLKPEEVCGLFLGPACGEPYFPWEDWNITLPDIPQPPPVDPTPPKAGSPSYSFVHLTDIHFDPQYLPGSKADCGDPLCCRASSGRPDESEEGAWKFGDYRNCDTPLGTLESLFQHLALEQHTFDYVVWTGDVPAHNVWNQSREAQVRTIQQVTALFHKYLPTKVVYPSLGNHEGSPVNSFPPPYIKGSDSIDWLYQALAQAWSKWLPADALTTVRKGAYYTVSPRPGHRIVSLNMNYCNNQNWWLFINMTDPAGELQWLIHTLQAAETAGEKVHILGHIPPGINDCLEAWSWNYYKVVSRYQNTIAGQFFGHTHTDSFTVFYDVETVSRPVGVAYVAPSVTPYTGLNMGYRIYTVDGHYNHSSYQVLDHSTYILDLEKAHNEGKITWQFEYSAKAAYSMNSTYPKDWDKLIDVMKTNNTMLDLYNRFYSKSRDSGACDADCRKARLCEARTGRSHDPSFCKDLDIPDVEEHHRILATVPKHC